VRVDLGVRYPSRTFFVNPSPATGTLRTVGTTDGNFNISIDNANASGETGDYWNGTDRSFNTGALAYEPRYNEYDDAPTTIYEQSLLYNQFDDANITISEQSMIDGRQINLVALNGSLSESGTDSTSVSVRPVSASTNEVAVEGDGGDPINITVPTRLDESTWFEALEPELDDNGGNIVDREYDSVPGQAYALLTIQLNGSKTYDLQMAKVGFGSDVSEASDRLYLTDEGGTSRSVGAGNTESLTVQVRDEFNNPVSGEEVEFDADDGEFDETGTGSLVRDADSEGRVTATYRAPDDGTSSDTVTATIGSGSDRETVEFDISVGSGDGNSGTYSIGWNETVIETNPDNSAITDCSTGTCTYDLADGNDATLTAEASVSGATVDFSIDKGSPANLTSPEDNETDTSGRANTTLDVDGSATDGETFNVHVNSGGSGDVLEITLDRMIDGFAVTITGTNSPVEQGNDLTVDFEVENTGSSTDTQTIEFDFDRDGTVDASETKQLAPGETYASSFSYDTYGENPDDYDVAVSTDNDTAVTTVTVDPSQGTIEGTVTDTNGDPIQGATVTVDETGDSATTDSSGFYEITSVESGEKTVTASASGYSTVSKSVDVPPQGDVVTVDYQLSSDTGTIEGTVTDTNGDAVGGATVTVESTGQSATTASDGSYSIADVPEGDQNVTANADGFKPRIESVTVQADNTVTQDYTLEQRTVSGTVTDADTGDAIDGATVTLEDSDGNVESTTTGSDGGYAFTGVAADEYTVTADADGYGADSATVSIASGDGDVVQDFQLDPEPGTLSGQVTDSETGDPIESATVTIEETGQEATTDSNGEYTIDPVDQGTYNVTVRHPDYVNETVEVTVSPGEDVTQNYALADTDGTIFGVVRDSNTNDELANVEVTVYEAGTGTVVGQTTTDSAGEYEFVVEGGVEYDVVANGSEIGYNTKEATNVAVSENEDVRVDFDLDPVTAFGASNDWGNNDDLYTEFTVSNADDPDHDFAVDMNYQGNSWRSKSVTIDGNTYTLTATAADAITSGQERDLFDAANYESVDQATLNGYRADIDENSEIVNEIESGSATLDVRLGPKR